MSPYVHLNTPETQEALKWLEANALAYLDRTDTMTDHEKEVARASAIKVYQLLKLPEPEVHFVRSPMEAYAANSYFPKTEDRDSLSVELLRLTPSINFYEWDYTTIPLIWKIANLGVIRNRGVADRLYTRSSKKAIVKVARNIETSFNNVKIAGRSIQDAYPFVFSHGSPHKIPMYLVQYLSSQLPPDVVEQYQTMVDFTRTSHSQYLTDTQCFICDFPEMQSTDNDTRCHNETGPAVLWRDGTCEYYWHGMPIPCNVVKDPSSITVKQIEKERNAEIRRVMIDQYGVARYLRECGLIIDETVDEVGNPLRLYCRSEDRVNSDEPIVMLEMTNSTVDPDGTVRTYMRRVPPNITSAIEARNWVCGLDEGLRIDVQT